MSSKNDQLMDTEPGGESRQWAGIRSGHRIPLTAARYESIKTSTVPHAKQSGQLGGLYSMVAIATGLYS
jgi:hypothetical protein